MDIKTIATQMDQVVSQGAIVDAVQEFFADNATTSDYNGGKTENKQQMVEKMQGFAGAIEQVNGITHHATIVDGLESASEFTFDFNMKDGSQIYWHEIIRRTWNDDGKVAHEEYFNAQ